MRYYKHLYLTEGLEKKKEKIIRKLEAGKLQPGVHVITLAVSERNQLETIYYNNCVLRDCSVRLIRLRRPDLAPDLYLPFGLYRIDVFCHQCLLADQAFCIRLLSLLIKVLHRKWSRQKQKQERNYDKCTNLNAQSKADKPRTECDQCASGKPDGGKSHRRNFNDQQYNKYRQPIDHFHKPSSLFRIYYFLFTILLYSDKESNFLVQNEWIVSHFM